MSNKFRRHMEICEELNAVYVAKNTAYNDSFGKTFKKKGIQAALTRIEDKWNRVEALANGTANAVSDERLEDTLLDMANYCIMTLIELEGQEQ